MLLYEPAAQGVHAVKKPDNASVNVPAGHPDATEKGAGGAQKPQLSHISRA